MNVCFSQLVEIRFSQFHYGLGSTFCRLKVCHFLSLTEAVVEEALLVMRSSWALCSLPIIELSPRVYSRLNP